MKKLLLATAGGDAAAQSNLGIMLYGTADPADQPAGQNRAQAIAWLLKSALQGLPRAHPKLAEVYASPPLARGDEVRACTWFLVAAATATASGVHLYRAKAEFDRLAAGLSPGQLKVARVRARTIVKALREQVVAAA